MPLFAYEAMNSSGQEVKDEVEAASSEEAIAKIRGKGYFPTKVKEKSAKKQGKKKGAASAAAVESVAPKKRKMPISIGGVPRKQLVTFTRQLSTLQDAGLPILRSLQILEQQQKPGLLKAIVGGVGDEVEGGGTLSDAMAQIPQGLRQALRQHDQRRRSGRRARPDPRPSGRLHGKSRQAQEKSHRRHDLSRRRHHASPSASSP